MELEAPLIKIYNVDVAVHFLWGVTNQISNKSKNLLLKYDSIKMGFPWQIHYCNFMTFDHILYI